MRRKPHHYSCRLSYPRTDKTMILRKQASRNDKKSRKIATAKKPTNHAYKLLQHRHESSNTRRVPRLPFVIRIYSSRYTTRQCDCEMPYSKQQLLYSFFRRALKPNRNVPKTRSESRLVVSSQMLLLPERLRLMYSTTAAPCTRLPTP